MSARSVTYSFLLLGSLSTFAFMLYAADGVSWAVAGFTLWALIPYAVFAVSTRISRTRGSVIAAAAVSIAAVFVGAFLYMDAFLIHISSTSALAFIFIPLYQLLAAVVVLVFALERRCHASQDI